MPLAIKINPADNVVVALHPIAKGTAVPVDNGTVTVTAVEGFEEATVKNLTLIREQGAKAAYASVL